MELEHLGTKWKTIYLKEILVIPCCQPLHRWRVLVEPLDRSSPERCNLSIPVKLVISQSDPNRLLTYLQFSSCTPFPPWAYKIRIKCVNIVFHTPSSNSCSRLTTNSRKKLNKTSSDETLRKCVLLMIDVSSNNGILVLKCCLPGLGPGIGLWVGRWRSCWSPSYHAWKWASALSWLRIDMPCRSFGSLFSALVGLTVSPSAGHRPSWRDNGDRGIAQGIWCTITTP